MTSPDSQAFSCLVVEDCDHDYQMLERLLRRSEVPLSVRRCAQGTEAMSFLNRSEASSEARPAVIILDLDLSGSHNGREILNVIRRHPQYKWTPVVVFSASTNPSDIAWCQQQGVSAYQVKNTDLMSFKCVADLVVKYWRCGDVAAATTITTTTH